MAAPASVKARRTKVALAWFYDPARKTWRFAPVDTTHRAEREQRDPSGQEVQPLRTIEAKGWIPAAVAAQAMPEARKSMPAPVRAMFPEQAKAEA